LKKLTTTDRQHLTLKTYLHVQFVCPILPSAAIWTRIILHKMFSITIQKDRNRSTFK
jgi:hypothetical protein